MLGQSESAAMLWRSAALLVLNASAAWAQSPGDLVPWTFEARVTYTGHASQGPPLAFNDNVTVDFHGSTVREQFSRPNGQVSARNKPVWFCDVSGSGSAKNDTWTYSRSGETLHATVAISVRRTGEYQVTLPKPSQCPLLIAGTAAVLGGKYKAGTKPALMAADDAAAMAGDADEAKANAQSLGEALRGKVDLTTPNAVASGTYSRTVPKAAGGMSLESTIQVSYSLRVGGGSQPPPPPPPSGGTGGGADAGHYDDKPGK